MKTIRSSYIWAHSGLTPDDRDMTHAPTNPFFIFKGYRMNQIKCILYTLHTKESTNTKIKILLYNIENI